MPSQSHPKALALFYYHKSLPYECYLKKQNKRAALEQIAAFPPGWKKTHLTFLLLEFLPSHGDGDFHGLCFYVLPKVL